MHFNILGAVELRDQNGPVDAGPAKQRAILAVLLVYLEHPVSLEGLVDRVWGESPPSSVRNVVYTYMARLRRTLAKCADAPVLRRSFGGYSLDIPPESVDLHRFRALLAGAREEGCPDRTRAELLQQALGLWRGEALSGIDGLWADTVRQGLRLLKHEALAELADVKLRLGCTESVADALREALVAAPGAESIARRLMQVLRSEGRCAEALEVYAETRRFLAEDYGIDPSPELQQLYDDLLQGRAFERPAPQAPAEPGERAPAPPRPAFTVHLGGEWGAINMLPIDLPDFTGRREEVDSIVGSLTPGGGSLSPSVAVVFGGAGMGKTVTAVRAAYRLRADYPDGQLFVSLGAPGAEPADPHAVLGRLLSTFLVGSRGLPASFTERMEVYRAVLSTKRLLIVLDDAKDDPQVAPLLPGTGMCAVLVTCRVRPPVPAGVHTTHLTRLPEDDARDLLTTLIGAERAAREPEATAELLRLCAGVPLLLRIVGGRLMVHPHWPVSRLVRRLADDTRTLRELTDGTQDFSASLRRSYDMLDAPARRVFRGLATLPHRDFSAPVLTRHLRVDHGLVEDALDRLVQCHLVEFTGQAGDGARYHLPDLHRLYARERLPDLRVDAPVEIPV